jgi:hypothetical protein
LKFWAAYGVSIAALFDTLENFGQAQQLLSGVVIDQMTYFVGVCAFVKFTLIMLFILYGLIVWVLPKNS